MDHFSRYYLTYRAAQGVNLRSKFGRFVYYAVVGSFSLIYVAFVALMVFAVFDFLLWDLGLI